MEWWVGQPGDPASLLERFCEQEGFSVDDLSDSGPVRHSETGMCGVALIVSSAAGSVMAGGNPGRPSPARSVPDMVAIAYAHDDERRCPVMEPAPLRLEGWVSSWRSCEHAAAVDRVRQAIAAGDVYQVNVVGHHHSRYAGEPASAVAAVSALPGGGYAGVMSGDDWAVASASPECFIEVVSGWVETRPIKGTRPATEAGAEELLKSVKERAEHVMIVDLERNDLARIAVPGSVSVTDFFALRRWCDLWQAESTVSARVAEGVGLAELLRAVCPPGSVTGAPKLAALDVIAAQEPVGRGPAMGAMGYLSVGRLVLGLTIRTVAVEVDRIHLWAGGGVTWRSDPDDEVDEALAKAAPVKAAVNAQTLGC
ncbi:MAG TPA: chorismate-binding protein [Candidatus Stackebrandtia excrementipullorum]|nr:chorismate-binding protein [Candidatus Stackebrandtia excrementipullorum]